MAAGYRLVDYRGERYSNGAPKLITLRIEQAMAKLEAVLGYTAGSLDLLQGCHHNGSLSANTHLRADVFDLSYNDWERKARAMIRLNVIPFVRPPNWDGSGGSPHIHCILPGSEHLDPSAAQQVVDWSNHIDGLAGHDTRYTGPWGEVGKFNYEVGWRRDGDKDDPPPPRKPTFPDVSEAIGVLGGYHAHGWTVEQDLEVKAHNHPNIQPMQDALAAVKAALPAVRDARTALVHWRNVNQGD